MSYSESTMVVLHCDTKDCRECIRVSGDDHNQCQILLLGAGWGLSHGKQMCPFHVAKRIRASGD